jgi:hypothetical protein
VTLEIDLSSGKIHTTLSYFDETTQTKKEVGNFKNSGNINIKSNDL